MRLKANKMGYSLNQRGLFADVVRSTDDRTVKTNAGESRLSDSVLGPLAPLLSPFLVPSTPMSMKGDCAWSVLGLLIGWRHRCELVAASTRDGEPKGVPGCHHMIET